MAKKAKRTYGDRRAKAAGVLTKPALLRRSRATRLMIVNAPNTIFMRRRHTMRAVGQIHGFKTVNAPSGGRRSAGSSPSLHSINAPRGQW